MKDYKEGTQAIADDIAFTEYNKDFYELNAKIQAEVYEAASERFFDGYYNSFRTLELSYNLPY